MGTLRDKLAAMVAVGTPLATFKNPNAGIGLAEDVLVAPSMRSFVILEGLSTPEFSCQYCAKSWPLV